MKTKQIRINEYISKPVFWMFIVLYAAVLAASGLLLSARVTGFYLLYVFSRFIFFADAVLAAAVFLSCSQADRNRINEVICAAKGKGYYQRIALWITLAYAALLQITMLLALFIAGISNDGTDYFAGYIWKSYVFNILIPMLVCIFISYFLSLLSSTTAASVLLIVFIILISPVFQLLSWVNKPSFPIDKILTAVLHPFRIFYENGDWAGNAALGLQTDASRGCILLFWILLFAGMTVWICRGKTKASKRISGIIAMFLSVCALASLTWSYLPNGSYRITENWDGAYEDFYTYYDQEPGIQTVDASYRITNYDISLDFGRFMYADAELKLEAENPQDEFVFTLYHGYTITDLSGTEDLQWSVEGDLVTVKTVSPVSDLTLNISYYGSHSIFYSYSEGALLPGWFAWYPMAGKMQVWLNLETTSSFHNTFNRIETADITLRISGNFATVSNLEKISDNIYSGRSDSITLIGGEIEDLGSGQVADCIPLDLTAGEDEFSESLIRQWQEICDSLESYGLNLPADRDCRIIVAPTEIMRFYYQNGLAIFDDYILTYQYGISMQNVSTQMILKANPDSSLASIICGMGGLDDTAEGTFDSWFQKASSASAGESGKLLYNVLLAANACDMGEDAVCRIARFLCTDGAAVSETEFLESLAEEYVEYK